VHWLKRERSTMDRLLPGLDEALADVPLMQLEEPPTVGLEAFREAGGPGLLVPGDHLGAGATAVEAVQIQRAVGSRAPSVAVAVTMHHYSIATFMAFLAETPRSSDWLLLDAVAEGNLLVASGFAEGRTGRGTQQPTMDARPTDGGFVLNGTKKPCSLSHSMDMMTASLLVPSHDGDGRQLAVALIPASGDGIERTPFWSSPILAAAESHAVTLHDVEVPDRLVFRSISQTGEQLDVVQISSSVWFELLISAAYLGVASRLIELVLIANRGTENERASLVGDLEMSAAAIEGLAHGLEVEGASEELLVRTLLCRYSTQSAIARTTAQAVELLGGMAFIGSPEVAYLYAAAQCLSFHPPGRSRASESIAKFVAGNVGLDAAML
jgi:alkylation response protein AidB-like acyl-CoA dehydrogenase